MAPVKQAESKLVHIGDVLWAKPKLAFSERSQAELCVLAPWDEMHPSADQASETSRWGLCLGSISCVTPTALINAPQTDVWRALLQPDRTLLRTRTCIQVSISLKLAGIVFQKSASGNTPLYVQVYLHMVNETECLKWKLFPKIPRATQVHMS